jgi:hypothetical protein
MPNLPVEHSSPQRRIGVTRHGAPNLTAAERRRVTLAALQLLEAEHLRRISEIRRDRESLLAQGAR